MSITPSVPPGNRPEEPALDFSVRGQALLGQEMFKVLERAKKIEEAGAFVYHLELGNPRQPPPRELMDQTLGLLGRGEVGYTYSLGLPVLRQAIAKRYSERLRCPVSEHNVAISPANLLITQFLDLVCNPGDKVVFFCPAFPTYWASASYIGLKVESIPLDERLGYDLTDADVDRAIASGPRAILVNSANNPTGAVYSQAVLERLARLCDQHGIWLLSDETYADICYGRTFFTMATLTYPRLAVMSSFSKVFSIPGFRTGYIIAHPQMIAKISLSTSTLISCLPTFTQLGCAAGVNVLDRYTASVRARCASVMMQCGEILGRCPGLTYSLPHSGFYIFINIAATGLDADTFCWRLLDEQHTAVTPGNSFGVDYRSYVRVAICGRTEDVREGMRRLVAFVETLLPATAVPV